MGTRSKGLTVNWSGGDPVSTTFLVVAGADLPANASAVVLCMAPQGSASFTIPADVLANLPATRIRPMQSRGVIYVGQWNIDFVHRYVAAESLHVVAEDLDGPYPRKVYYSPRCGTVRVRYLRALHNDTIVVREREYQRRIEAEAPMGGSIDLF